MDRKRLKILLSNHHGSMSTGSAFQLYLLAKELVARGHEVWGLTRGKRGTPLDPSWQKLIDLGVKVDRVRYEKLKYWHTIPELVWETRFLLREKFDIVASFGGTDLDHNFIASTFAPVPALICIRGMAVPLDLFNSIKYRLPQIKKILAVSEAVKRVMVETGRVNPDKIAVVYPGLELDRFRLEIDRAAVRKSLGLAADAQVVIIIDGYFKFTPENNKGGYYFVKAAEKIMAQKPGARFLIVGDSSVERFNRLASPAVKEASILTQHRSDIPELLAASDVLVCASLMEGLGMVCAEALAMKKPVVGTEVGGIPELVRPGQTGILVPPRNGEAIANGVLDLLENPEKARQFGENGRKFVEEYCDNRRRVDRIEQIFYEECEKSMSKRNRK